MAPSSEPGSASPQSPAALQLGQSLALGAAAMVDAVREPSVMEEGPKGMPGDHGGDGSHRTVT